MSTDTQIEIEDHYVLVLDSKSTEQLEFEKIQQQQNIYLELNIIDDYLNVTQDLIQQLNFSDRIQRLSILLEGCKNIEQESYQNIAKILSKGKQSVQYLSLEVGFENNFNDQSLNSICDEIQQYQQLTNLNFILRANNEFNINSANIFAKLLENQQNLTQLTLFIEDGNQFTGEHLQIISNSLQKLEKLVKLRLIIGDYQKIQERGCQAFGESIQNLKNLETFVLQIGNNCEFNNFQSLGSSLSNLQKLKEFSFTLGRKNNKQAENLVPLGEGLKQISSITNFTFKIGDSNNIGAESIKYISQGIAKQVNLEKFVFYIGHLNKISTEGGVAFGSSLHQSTKLKEIKLFVGSLNNFGQEGFTLFSQSLAQQSDLENLTLEIGSDNNIETEGIRQLGLQTKELNKLQQIIVKIEDRNNVEIGGALVCFQIWSNIESIQKVYFNIQNVFQMIFNEKDQILDLQFKDFISQVEYPTILEAFQKLNKLENLQILLDQEVVLSTELLKIFTQIYEGQQNLKYSRFKSTSNGKSTVAEQFQLFYQLIKQPSIVKAEVDIVDVVKAQIDNQSSKKRGQKVVLSVASYNNCSLEGCQQMAEIIKYVKKTVKSMTIQIGTENKLNLQCGKILCKEVFGCQSLTQITFDLDATQQQHQLQQQFRQIKTIIHKCVADRERIVNTYLRFFSKALSDYPQQQRGSLLKHICGILPLMKEFNLANQAAQPNQFGGGFGQNQFIQNAFVPDLDIDEPGFEYDEEF